MFVHLGIVAFHEVPINETDLGGDSVKNTENTTGSTSVLDQNIEGIRDALGLELQSAGLRGEGDSSELEDLWSQHLGELGDKLNQEGDRSGFLRMVNRSHAFNSSNYSLSSLFSLGSVSINSGSTSRPGSTRSRRSLWQGPAALRSLYDILLAPIQEQLSEYAGATSSRELVLILDGDLYLVPFALLKPQNSSEYLCERFSLMVTPSLTSMRTAQKIRSRQAKNTAATAAVAVSAGDAMTSLDEPTSALVIGNPKIMTSVTEQWGWGDAPYSQQEAVMVSEMLQTSSLLSSAQATKDAVLRHISQVDDLFIGYIIFLLS